MEPAQLPNSTEIERSIAFIPQRKIPNPAHPIEEIDL
jgi:hypothetical protein